MIFTRDEAARILARMSRSSLGLLAVLLAVGCEEAAPPAGEAGTSGGGTSDTEDSVGTTSATTTSQPTTSAESSSSSDGESSSSDSDGWVDIDCSEHCDAPDTEGKQMLCYACRCKNAMDGFMPSPEQLQCSRAEELTIYTADVSGPEPQLVPLEGDATSCANPALLTERCGPGSRLGQLQEGDIFVKWICRDPDPDTGIFADAGAIMYNARNGATCYFDDVDFVTGMDDWPHLDFDESDQANFEDYVAKFYFTDGASCSTDCHDADPFIYTPYFQSVAWVTGNYVIQPYGRVNLEGELDAIDASHLVSPEVLECRQCHRLGSAAGCDLLGPDALGEYKNGATEQAVVDATEPGSPHWKLAYWMPNGREIESFAMWTKTYGEAKERLTQCCEQPGVDTPGCDWEPIPTE
jgi:hypothetical protein